MSTKLKISVIRCPKCAREVVAKGGIIQPHVDMAHGGWCKGAAKGNDNARLHRALDAVAKDTDLVKWLALLTALYALYKERQRPQETYDLTKYRPKPREF